MGALNFRIEREIAFIEFDEPGSKVNVLNTAVMTEFNRILDDLSGKIKPMPKALIITSKKDGIFIAGADIKEIENISSRAEAQEKAAKGKEVFEKLSNLNLISVAVINGVVLGGGLELALACRYRIATFSDKVKLGLPEVRLGVIPGFGGTIRLPKIVGLPKALGMILSGDAISGIDGLKSGLVDRLIPENKIPEESINFANEVLEGKFVKAKPKKKSFLNIFLEGTPFGRNIIFNAAKNNVLKKTKGFYPATLKAIEAIRKAYGRNILNASAIESKIFAELAITDVSKNLIKVFYLIEEFKKYPWVSGDVKPREVSKCGVVGAGVMGGGIAQLLSFYNYPVRLKDINYDALKTAFKTAKNIFDYAVKKKILKPHQAEQRLGFISATTSYRGFENIGFVIEAVVEDLNVKKKVFSELSKVTPKDTVLASNTSSIPIIDVSERSDFPERVIGLHFFNPVHRMPLVEVIRSRKTDNETTATTVAFARKIGKTVIVVGDVTGFLINRILLSYLNEAGYLLEEGLPMERIDKIAKDFGMPMGPIELIDEIGVDVGYKVANILEGAYGARMAVSPVLRRVKEKKFLGKKTKVGFYIYKGKNKKPNSGIYELLKEFPKKDISDDTALKRLVYVMINEAARCLEEKVADRPETIDIGMIMGTGYPPFRAGLLRYADSIGIDNIVQALTSFEKEIGSIRFKPTDLLISMRDKKERFYSSSE